MDEAENQRATEEAGNALNIGRQYVSDAATIKEENPELFQAIHRGSVTLQDAKRQLKKRQKHEDPDDQREASQNRR